MKTDLSLKHIPPQAIELEESVIVSCFLERAEEALKILSPDDFYKTAHQKIFSAIFDLSKQKIQVDLPLVVDALRSAGHLEEVGGASYIASLLDGVPIASNVGHYARKIKNKAILRKLINHCHTITKACFQDSSEVETIIDDAQKRILSIEHETIDASNETAVSYRELSLEAGERYEDLSKRKGSITGIASGFYMLDYITCGFQNTDLIILAGRPGMGKTALALNIAGNVGKQDTPTAYFSLEMSKTQLFDRQIAGESGVNSQKFRSGRFEPDDWEAINRAQGKVYTRPVFIDDSAALHYMEIRRRAWGLKKNHGIKLVIIDHLQLIRGDKASTRDREIGSITAGLKATAKELNIPIILLSQLNRELERRPNPHKRPRMSDLRDSGNIEQDADIVAFLYRPGVYEDEEEFGGHAELNVAKQRNGPTGMIKLRWHDKTTKFQNLETKHDEHTGA